MNLDKVFDFDDDIFPWIIERVKRTVRKRDVQQDVDAIKVCCNAHIVGQVNDDLLLFTWDGKPDQTKSEMEITYFCLYNLTTKKSSILFDHDRKVDVVTASVNEERTLLAFTVIEFKPHVGNPAEESVGTYKSIIAEISPKNRVFKLAVDQPHYQKVQFLHGKYPLYGGSARRESHMLFFHHTKSIDLYHIPLARIDCGMIMSSQPQVENLVKRFVWAQFDRHRKRLYYVYSESEDEDVQDLIFSAIQFCETSPRVVTMKLICPFSVGFPSNKRLQYDRKPLSKFVSESDVNMQVVSSPDGSFFLCYQHPLNEDSRPIQDMACSKDDADGSGEFEPQQSVLEYSILMLHHGSILRCKVPNVVPSKLIDQARLLFIMLNDCIAVILPGYVFHILDCNAEHPPCHHLFLSGPDTKDLPNSDEQLSEFTCFNSSPTKPLQQEELQLFEPKLCKLFKLNIKNNYWTDCFLSTHCDTTRLALLHFSILHIQDPDIMLQIFGHLACDPANPECVDLLNEYLIGSTYFQMKFQVEASFYKLLPFSNTEPFRGHLETNRNGEKIAQISYTERRSSEILNQTFKDEKRKELEFWVFLRQNLSFACFVERFSLKNISKQEERLRINGSSSTESGLTSIFQKFRRFQSVESQIQGSSEFSKEYKPEYLEFIQCDDATMEKEERRSIKVLESLTRFFHRYLPSEVPKMKIQKIAMEYITCQKKQSSKLLDLFWSGLNYSEDTHPYDHSLNTRGTSRERALLMLFERYHMAVNQIHFPIPTGFHTFFVFMGFRCLEERLFIQYVINKIFSLETEFMYRLLHDVGNDESYSHLISRLIGSFDQPTAIHLLEKWDSPGVSRILCQRYVSNLLTEGDQFRNDARDFLTQSRRFDEFLRTVSSLKSSGSDHSESETVPFRPLLNVMAALNATVSQSKKPSIWKGNRQDLQSRTSSEMSYVSKNALEHTTRNIDDVLGLGAF